MNRQPELPPGERQALAAFYRQTEGDAWTDRAGWLTDAPPCTWTGVTCEGGHVVALDLPENNLHGTLPPEIAYLTELRRLDLSGNHLRGALPPQVGHLRELQVLDLAQNRLRGELPPRLRLLRNLRVLDLRDNQLSGPLPVGLGDLVRLERLNLATNEFSGPVPAELGSLRNLIELHLNDTKLGGPLPLTLVQLTALATLAFARTGLMERTAPAFRAWLDSIDLVDSTGAVFEEVVPARGNPMLAALAGMGTLGLALIAALIVALPLGPIAGAITALGGVAGAGLVGKTVYDLTGSRRGGVALPGPQARRPDEALRGQLRRELRGLVGSLAGRVPPAVLARVEDLERAILDVMPRIERIGSGDPDAYTVRQTIRDYLPEALAPYRALPRDFAAQQPLQSGRTADEHVIEQIELLQQAIDDIAGRLPKEDAQRLLAHGRFLRTKFSRRSEENPLALDNDRNGS